MKSLSFCLLDMSFFITVFLNNIIAGYKIQGCQLFSFSTLIHSVLWLLLFLSRSQLSVILLPHLKVIHSFSLCLFFRFSFCLCFSDILLWYNWAWFSLHLSYLDFIVLLEYVICYHLSVLVTSTLVFPFFSETPLHMLNLCTQFHLSLLLSSVVSVLVSLEPSV